MEYRIDTEERATFKRCRRQWDFASPHRRDLVADDSAGASLSAALKDALAVYYYPGTWDWDHNFKQSLVHKSLRRSLDDDPMVREASQVLDCYDAWARIVDDFAPVKIDHEVRCLIPDPRDPDRALAGPDGTGVTFSCRVDLLAVDTHDEYWVVSHRIVEDWLDPATLLRDEEAIAACWAWEQDYLGMNVAGTIHNEVRIGGALDLPVEATAAARVAQHEPSGGGRSIPQHQRTTAVASRGQVGDRFAQSTWGILRRTRIRRAPAEIAAAAATIAAEADEMTLDPAVYPSPGSHCAVCAFAAPCLAMYEGADPQTVLSERFRRRPVASVPEPRLGQSNWGFGRGAAPPRWAE